MADDMSWRSTASSRLSSFKGYLSSQRPEMKQVLSSSFRRHQGQDSPDGKSSVHSWREWAGQKIGRGQSYDLSNAGVDKIWLFPGWATRRYRKSVGGELEGTSITKFWRVLWCTEMHHKRPLKSKYSSQASHSAIERQSLLHDLNERL